MTLEGRRPGEDSRASPSRRGPGSGCTGECAEADDPSGTDSEHTDSEHRRHGLGASPAQAQGTLFPPRDRVCPS